jgi:hypothetical protein
MIDSNFAREFAEEWIGSWNSHDMDRIMSHYTEDFEMSSPFIISLMNEPSGTLKGKQEVRRYWERGLAANPNLKFDLLNVLTGANSVTLIYKRNSVQLAAEVLTFNERREVIKGMAHYE